LLKSELLIVNLTAYLASAGVDARAVAVSELMQSRLKGSNGAAVASLAGIWEEVGGRYLLRRCPTGSLLVNTSLEAQQCVACEQGTYTTADIDGCSGAGGVCQQRKCTTCPLGAECIGGLLRGRVGGSVWRKLGQYMRLDECPAGYIVVRLI
jgi:hypothetical protein